LLSVASLVSLQAGVLAHAADTPGVTDTEIKIGQTMPYSGPTSAYGVIGRTEMAYFRMINEQGGVNGRKIALISLDDGGNPANTLEQTRRLVEQEQVAFLFQTVGTAPNSAIRDYLNSNKVPQLFVGSGATKFSDPKHYPWTMGYLPSYQMEARFYGEHILKTVPGAKIAVLYQNDDFGRDYLIGLKAVLGPERAKMIAKEASYEVSEPTVDSQIVLLQGSGANVFLIAATPKFAAQAIRKSFDIGWSAARYLSYVSRSLVAVLKPAGLNKSVGITSALYFIDVSDSRWSGNPDVKAWKDFTSRYMSPTEFADVNAASGFCAAATMTQVLKQCGDDLSRDNVMKQAANLTEFRAPLLMPGITINTSPDNYSPIRQLELVSFDGGGWRPLGRN
jgi:branched-chain amino acid transport system substrate-binding protein